jgi:uncharacterized Ntn-hydrolase superfamily protein
MSKSTSKIHPSTFSIVARDLANGDLGVAVQSKFLAVGSVVPFARDGVGAVATQSYANVAYGPEGLRLMAAGWNAQEALNHLLTMDLDVTQRQVLLVDAAGGAAGHTGEKCHDWAGHILGDGYACGGNILVGEATVQAMAKTFEEAQGPLPERLTATLAAVIVEASNRPRCSWCVPPAAMGDAAIATSTCEWMTTPNRLPSLSAFSAYIGCT